MNKGNIIEYVFINNLDGKKFSEINLLLQELIKALYPSIKENDKITAYKYGKYAKTDIVVIVRGIKKGISIKSGAKNSVHLEKSNKFIKYLKKINFKKTDELLRYLYSDETNNNTGTIRMSAEEYKKEHQEEIIAINDALDKCKKNLIYRFLIKTDINYRVPVDVFVWGHPSDFLWATKDEIVDYLNNKKIETTGIQVGGLFLQNWDKNLYNPKYEKCREYVQIKWYSIFDDIIFIMCERNNKNATSGIQKNKNKTSNNFISKLLKFITHM